MLKNGIGASIFLFLSSGACWLGILIAGKLKAWDLAIYCNTGMVATFTLGIVVLILTIALHYSIESAKARNNQPSNVILIRNGEARQVNPNDIPYYIEGNPQRELPSGRQGSNQPIKLDQQTLEALALILNQSKRYIPASKNDRSENITEY